jgi:hypothetical protein
VRIMVALYLFIVTTNVYIICGHVNDQKAAYGENGPAPSPLPQITTIIVAARSLLPLDSYYAWSKIMNVRPRYHAHILPASWRRRIHGLAIVDLNQKEATYGTSESTPHSPSLCGGH